VYELSGTDAGFLYFETPASHMHVLGTVVVDTTGRPGWGYDDVVEHLRERASLAPMLSRRLVFGTLRLHHPVWVEDEPVDVARHLRRVVVPSPGT
jgi:hypothetical protein